MSVFTENRIGRLVYLGWMLPIVVISGFLTTYASGVSVGFSKKYLEEFAAQYELTGQGFSGQFSKVEYCLEKQKELLRTLYEAIKDAASRGGMGLPADNDEMDAFIELDILGKVSLAAELYRVKDNGFSKEEEWRIVVPLREIDLAGYGCKHRIRDGKIVPYKDFSFDCSGIREVVLGPKNLNSEQAVAGFLNSNGIWGVPVRKSDIPYC